MGLPPKTAIVRVLTAEQSRVLPEFMVGFAYWLFILLMLEPANVWRAFDFGYALHLDQELIRITGAGILGGLATPLLLEQMRRFPVEGLRWRVHALVQGFGCMALAAGLIFLSCLAAKAMLTAEVRPLATAMQRELTENWALLVFCLAAFVAVGHALRFWANGHRPQPMPSDYVAEITIRERGRATLIPTEQIKCIEAQGNYVALHTETGIHLLRDTLADVERRLNPDRFLRIHRSMIVAVDRIASLTSIGAGDAQILLKDGSTLRASRTYRDRLEAMLRERG